MAKKLYVILLFLFFCSNDMLIAQNHDHMAYVSGNVGGFISANKYFSKTYDSDFGFAFGAGFGVPILNDLYICGNVTYFTKNGIPWLSTYDQNGHLVPTIRVDNGTSTFRQWIVNGGLQYNYLVLEQFLFSVSGGITYSAITEKATININNVTDVSQSGSGILGYYLGLGIERSFSNSSLSAFAEAQYNFSRDDIFNLIGNYGGANLSLGIRYYFNDRRQ
jgi:hypothetical protein